jgi:hypothetical protein
MLFAIMNVTIVRILGRLTSWTHVADNHGCLLTSNLSARIVGQQ